MQIHKKWSEEEKESLKIDYGVLTSKELEEKYKRKYSTIRNAAIRFGIKSNRQLPKCNKSYKKWTKDEEIEFIKDWKDRHIKSKILVEKYKRSYESLKKKAIELNIERELNIDENNIIDLYNKKISSSTISRKYKVSQSTILKILKRNDVAIRQGTEAYRKINRDSNYFEIINSEHKAYWLGFLYADGCVKNGELSIALKGGDFTHLEKLKNDLKLESSVRKYNASCNGKKYPAVGISIRDNKLTKDLIDKGCFEKKSFILKFPTEEQVPKKLIHHFIRGYFDGDGCISKSKNRFTISFVGTYEILKGIKGFLNISNKISSRKNVFTLSVTSKNNIINIIDTIYNNPSIYLERKYKIIKECRDFYVRK